MAYYTSPQQMYEEKAMKAKKAGDVHWAMAKSGEGDQHFGIAKKFYGQADRYKKNAESASPEPWKKKGRRK